MRWLRAFVLWLVGACLLFGQASTTGSIQGTVVDSSGAPVAGARVSARSAATGTARGAVSDAAGRYLMSGVPIGEYTLSVEAEGFTAAVHASVPVSLGQTTVHRTSLAPAMLKQRVEVTDSPEALQSTASTASVALGGERVEEAPAQNRNYLNFVLAAPAVTASAGSNTSRSTAGTRGAANDSGFVFAGVRGRNNAISIDGVDNRDETTGGNRVALGIEMVQEFRVSGSTIAPEFGGAAGAIVNVVTRSGVNLWHGDFTMFAQHEGANARNAEVEEGGKGRFRRYQPGTSAYGPLRRDRTFVAWLMEVSRESAEEFSDAPESALASIRTALAAPRYRNAGVRGLTRGLYPAEENDIESFLKLDHRFNDRHSVTARWAFSRGRVERDVQGVDNIADVSARGGSLLRDQAIVGGWTAVVSPAWLNDLRFQVAHRRAELTPNSRGPMYEIPGVVTFGEAWRLNGERTETHGEAVESVQWVRRRHLFAAGMSVHSVGLNARLANRFHGIFVFPSLTAFLAGEPDIYTQTFGNPATAMRTTPAGMWVQDRWQPGAGLTIEAGVRYDHQWMPTGIPSSNRNFAPRLGVAWRPGTDSGWVLRAGAGLFFDRYPLAYLNEAVQKDGVRAAEVYLAGAAARAAFDASGGGWLAAPPAGAPLSAYRAAADFPATYSRKLIAGIERSLDRNTTLTLEYTNLRALHLPRIRNVNATLPAAYQLEQNATSAYQGASFTLHRHLSRNTSYLAAYTVGRARDDSSDFDEQPSDPRNLHRDWGPSRQDQRHRFTCSGLFDLPNEAFSGWLREAFDDISLAPIFTAGSGRPVNVLAATDLDRTGAYPIAARPAGVARNPALSPANVSLDVRVMKTFRFAHDRSRLQFGVESFNLLNHRNVQRVSPYAGAAFGRPVEIGSPRQVQAMMQLEY